MKAYDIRKSIAELKSEKYNILLCCLLSSAVTYLYYYHTLTIIRRSQVHLIPEQKNLLSH